MATAALLLQKLLLLLMVLLLASGALISTMEAVNVQPCFRGHEGTPGTATSMALASSSSPTQVMTSASTLKRWKLF
ncbi:hypothetical protein OPV22_007427 [Ensete ventricosum]|uniref:Uncharacterized protein n=1 Tax=Ensete ventricosum TaxID=4639 RepID=A0AAV8RMV8_ENSVE|nr:hypothetical protein OPV22_007427 [Ensete ventricosum]